nr:hypothetical protein [Tanacetum cinerariifolium]
MAYTKGSLSNPPKKRKPTIIPPSKLFVDLNQEDDDTHTPSPLAKSSSPSPPNAPLKTPSTKDTPSTLGTTSSSFNPLDAPPRTSNQLPLQSHPYLNIMLSLSPITAFDHMFETPPPPLPPPHQQPLMGHPIFFTILDYHGAHCL